MKIANVIRRFVFEEWGGTESAVWSLSKNFLQEGENAEILATTALCKCACEEKNKLKIKRFDYFYSHLFLDKKREEYLRQEMEQFKAELKKCGVDEEEFLCLAKKY